MARKPRLNAKHVTLGLTAALLFIAAGPLRVWFAQGAELGSRSVQLSDSRVSASANYILSFAGQSGGTVGSVRAQFCANDPLIGAPCTVPAGFDVSGATLTNQSGMTGFVVNPAATTANVLVLSRAPAPAPTGNSTYTLNGVMNPSAAGSYFIRLETFASTNASGNNTDSGGMVFSIDSTVSITTYVPPYLLFCAGITIQPYDCNTATGNYIDFGEFSTAKTSTGQTQLLLATNSNGYTVSVQGNTLTSGNNTIPALAVNDVSRTGVSQFGLNLRANTTPPHGSNVQGPGTGVVAPAYNTPDFYRFNSGEVVASASGPADYQLYTATYIVNIAQNQAPGVYVTTVTYVGLANF